MPKLISLNQLIIDIDDQCIKLENSDNPEVQKLLALVAQQSDIFESVLDAGVKNIQEYACLSVELESHRRQNSMLKHKLKNSTLAHKLSGRN